MKPWFRLSLVCLFLFFFHFSYAQDTTTLFRVETIDENEFIGRIIEQDAEKLILETNHLGTLTIPKDRVKRISAIREEQLQGGQLWFDNPQSTRYFWTPNGYGLKAGEGYYQNVWIFFNQVSFGLSDNVSLGLGMVPAFLFAGAPTPVWATPKFSVPIKEDKFNMGGGALIGTVIGEDTDGFFGIAYGLGTFGSRDKNLSLGLGYGFTGDGWAKAPTVNISALIRTGKRGYFVTENYIISTEYETIVLLFAGGRRVGDTLSLDYGLLVPISSEIGSFVAIPWLGIMIPFGS